MGDRQSEAPTALVLRNVVMSITGTPSTGEFPDRLMRAAPGH